MKKCPKCHRRYADTVQFCPEDGKTLVLHSNRQGTPIGIIILTIVMVIIALMFILPQGCQLRGTVTVTPSVSSTN